MELERSPRNRMTSKRLRTVRSPHSRCTACDREIGVRESVGKRDEGRDAGFRVQLAGQLKWLYQLQNGFLMGGGGDTSSGLMSSTP